MGMESGMTDGMTIYLDAMTCEQHRDVLSEWARANGFEPQDIPEDAKVVFDERGLTVEVVERDEGGKVKLDPSEPNRVKRVERTVPLVARWPLDPGPRWVAR